MKNTLLAILALAIFGFTSCEEEGTKPCSEERPTAAIVGEFPDSLKVGQTQQIQIQYVLDNSCGTFDRLGVTATDKTFEVQVITKYEGCNCNLGFSEQSTTYDIDIDFPGVYEYNFWQSDSLNDTRTLTIY